MKFGHVQLKDALGAVLAHTVRLAGVRLRKGHVLTASDLEALREEGVTEIIAARLDENDIEENEAARRVADAVSEGRFTCSEPFTGRVNIFAKEAGLFRADASAVNALNAIDPAITLATLADGVFVEAGRMVATVKIIPFSAAADAVAKAVEKAAAAEVVSLIPAKRKTVGLVSTCLPSLKPATMDKTRNVLEERLASAGSTLVDEVRVDHTEDALAPALSAMHKRADMTVVFGASAICDRGDVIPRSIVECGGEIVQFGMPVDPGNLLLVGQLDGRPVIGAPGCARSPAENGFDWVLQRFLCDLPVDTAFISALGVGGLLMEITSRPQPREANAGGQRPDTGDADE
ncbi:MAG: molybdopterin-binding protein [Pseudomonadota bacterium]